MLAQRLPGLLPPLTETEALEVTAIHSVAGLLADDTPLITRPPFVAPHHTSSVAALVGGGWGWRARARSAARIAGCCSSTSARRSGSVCWKHCELRWRTARFGWPAATASRATRPG